MFRLTISTKVSYFGVHVLEDGRILALNFQLYKPTDFWYYVTLKVGRWNTRFSSFRPVTVRNVGNVELAKDFED